MNPATAQWLLLIVSLPGATKAARMRLWRALKAGGAGALRDGVYALPASPTARAFLERQAVQAIAESGSAHVIAFQSQDAGQQQHLVGLFDRGAEWASLLEEIHARREAAGNDDATASGRALMALRRDVDALASIDFFPGPARAQVESALMDLEVAISRQAPGEPHARAGGVPLRHAADYQGRLWVTRARPWVDRLASAWLIARFIDAQARFRWLADVNDAPATAVGFDFDGAEFSHVGAKVSFEVLAASFGLDRDPALVRLGAVVNALDVGGAPAAEAAGLAAILRGYRDALTDDDALQRAASGVLDALYAGFSAGRQPT